MPSLIDTRRPKSIFGRDTTELFVAYGEFLRQFDWDWFVSLTFACPASRAGADLLFKRYFSRLRELTSKDITCFYVVEQSQAGTYHIHALLQGTSELPTRSGRLCWNHGHSLIRIYGGNLPAAFYVAKQLARNDVDFGFIGTPKKPKPRHPAQCADYRRSVNSVR